MSLKDRETYLGDGLYAHIEGAQVILRAPRENGDHWVALDDTVLQAFLQFIRDWDLELTASQGPE